MPQNNSETSGKNGNQKKLKLLFVSVEGLIGDLAWQTTKEGHDTRYYIEKKSEKDVCDGFVQKTDDWKSLKDWADVIIFDDTGFGSAAEALRKEGKPVVGGSTYTDKLEEDRDFGQSELEKAGVNILPHWEFTDFNSAIEFIKKNPARYVVKPSGHAQNEKQLTYIGKDDNGEDMMDMLELYKKSWPQKKINFQLQKFVQGVEIAVGAFFNGKDFITPIHVNFEYKKMFPGDIGPNTGEMGTTGFFTQPNTIFNETLAKMREPLATSAYTGYLDINCIVNARGIYPLEWTCFDKDTEVLTENGWKSGTEVAVGEKVLSIDPQTRQLGWKRVVNGFSRHYKGDMIRFGSVDKAHSALDALVTPEHKMLIDTSGRTDFYRADSLPHHETHIVRAGSWGGPRPSQIVIGAHVEQHHLGKHETVMEIEHASKHVDAGVWMEFLGLYLAEGAAAKGGYIISISQSPSGERREQIRQILDKMPFKYTEQKSGSFQISSIQLSKFLASLGLLGKTASEKFVPRQFKELHPDLLRRLIYGFALGDGNWHPRTGQLTFATASKKLADDLQEVVAKCGLLANILIRKSAGTMMTINGRQYERNSDLYVLSIREDKLDYYVDDRVTSRIPYSGAIWDVEVEDWHTLYVRRNGKPYFSGNCRFGYPTISLQLEGITSNMGEFLYGMAKGEMKEFKAKKGFQVCVVLAVPPYPFRDPAAFARMSEDAAVLFKKQDFTGVHLADVKLVEGDWRLAGQSGYAVIVTDTGPTMDEAREATYRKIKNIMIPNMFYRTDIGERWARDSDLLYSWGYLH